MMNKNYILKLAFIFIALLSTGVSLAQTQIYSEDFSTNENYTTSDPEFINGPQDYFTRTAGSNIGVQLNGNPVENFFAAQDIDDGATLPATLTISNIDISSYSSLEFRVYLAEDDDGTNQDWDNNDYVHFTHSIDGSGAVNTLWVENDGSQFNSAPFIDSDFDGVGDGAEITNTFQQFNVPISGTGSNLEVEIEFQLNSGDEDIAISLIEIYGISSAVNQAPEITNITQSPEAGAVTSSDAVSVSADITDNDSIASATLNWGTESGNLTNSIEMTSADSETYTTVSDIPSQTQGTTVYYNISATDANEDPETTTSEEQNYTVISGSPQITNITQNPAADNVTSNDSVSVSAEITDPNNQIASATLNWGTESGNLINSISMNNSTGDTYVTVSDIPSQDAGTMVYYSITAEDNSNTPESTTSSEQQYTVIEPSNILAIQDFDGTSPEWSYTSDVAFFDNGADGVFGVFDLSETNGTYTNPNFNANVLEVNDLDDENENGTSGSATLEFATIDISNSNNTIFSFDYEIQGFDSSDEIAYELFYDGTSQGEEVLPKEAVDSINVTIPNNVNSVSFNLRIAQNGASDYAALDNFKLEGSGTVANNPPSITNITQDPLPENVTSENTVDVSATITDSDGISSAILNWGISSDNLNSSITMTNTSGTTYQTENPIPAQSDSTTVYYRIQATDANDSPQTSMSALQSYQVIDPLPARAVIITEFLPNPENVNDANGEYFELYNRSNQDIDINGWSITDNSTESNTIDSSVIIPAHGFVVIGKNMDPTQNGGIKVDYAISGPGFNLANSDDEILLSDANGDEVDRVEYNFNTVWPGAAGAATYFTGQPTDNNNSSENWAVATQSLGITEDFGSPGFSGEATLPETFLYTDFYSGTAEWLPSNPSGTNSLENIVVIDSSTSVALSGDLGIYAITVKDSAEMATQHVLQAYNYINNNGRFVFTSNADQTGQLGQVPDTLQVFGKISVQRFMPAGNSAEASNGNQGRAFRFVSSSVTTSNSINAHWQEGVHNTGTDFPDDNLNPRSGYGTHITGSMQGNNGFDATPSGNPSLFQFDNTMANQSQAWFAVSNTASQNIIAGDAYRLFIRGDRSIDVTDNQAQPTNTTIETTGEIAIGARSQNNLNTISGNYSLVGNPYQAIININDVLAHSTNLNSQQYYVWDASIGDRGAYVTVDLSDGSNALGSDANQFVQPFQSFFVRTASAGNASISFLENDKATQQDQTTVFSNDENSAYINMQLKSNGHIKDGLRINFSQNATNAVLNNDARKLGNLDENLAVVNGGNFLSIEHRSTPVEGDTLKLYTNQYRSETYTLDIDVQHLNGATAYLHDNYLGTQVELDSDALNTIDFAVSEEGSDQSDRFFITFTTSSLSNDKFDKAEFRLYPNPATDYFYVTIPDKDQSINARVEIYDVNGKMVKTTQLEAKGNRSKVNINGLSAGVYMVKIKTGQREVTRKLIIK